MTVLERAQARLSSEQHIDQTALEELCDMVTARLCLRLSADDLPEIFYPIAADAAVKAYRRIYYEGVASESSVGSVSFIQDILAEYEDEIAAYKRAHAAEGLGGLTAYFI